MLWKSDRNFSPMTTENQVLNLLSYDKRKLSVKLLWSYFNIKQSGRKMAENDKLWTGFIGIPSWLLSSWVIKRSNNWRYKHQIKKDRIFHCVQQWAKFGQPKRERREKTSVGPLRRATRPIGINYYYYIFASSRAFPGYFSFLRQRCKVSCCVILWWWQTQKDGGSEGWRWRLRARV